jgi:hypothetical protein
MATAVKCLHCLKYDFLEEYARNIFFWGGLWRGGGILGASAYERGDFAVSYRADMHFLISTRCSQIFSGALVIEAGVGGKV